MINDSIGFDELYRLPNPLEFDCERVQQPLLTGRRLANPIDAIFLEFWGILGFSNLYLPLNGQLLLGSRLSNPVDAIFLGIWGVLGFSNGYLLIFA